MPGNSSRGVLQSRVQIRTGVSKILKLNSPFDYNNFNYSIFLFQYFQVLRNGCCNYRIDSEKEEHHGFLLGDSLTEGLLNDENEFFLPSHRKVP